MVNYTLVSIYTIHNLSYIHEVFNDTLYITGRRHFAMNGVKSGNLNPPKELKSFLKLLKLLLPICRALKFLGGGGIRPECKFEGPGCRLPLCKKKPHWAVHTSSRITASLDHSRSNWLQSVTLSEAHWP